MIPRPAPWMFRWAPEPQTSAIRGELFSTDGPVSYIAVVLLWQSSQEFRTFWIEALRNVPFAACFWETPGQTRDSATAPFECLFIDSPDLLATQADPAPFALHFSDHASAVSFPNLGRDTTLVVPTPEHSATNYAHLTAFMRSSTPQQQHAFWQLVGTTLDQHLDTQPLWLSTAGLGVAWLHVRLDSRPKYYRHQPYRTFALV